MPIQIKVVGKDFYKQCKQSIKISCFKIMAIDYILNATYSYFYCYQKSNLNYKFLMFCIGTTNFADKLHMNLKRKWHYSSKIHISFSYWTLHISTYYKVLNQYLNEIFKWRRYWKSIFNACRIHHFLLNNSWCVVC